MSAVIDVLSAARARVAVPGGWTRGGSRDGSDNIVACFDPAAVCWCVDAALVAAVLDLDDENERDIVLDRCREHLQVATGGACLDDVISWNDAPERAQSDVVAAYGRAIVLAGGAT